MIIRRALALLLSLQFIAVSAAFAAQPANSDFSAVVLLTVKHGKNEGRACAASVIDDFTLITAGHCVVNQKTRQAADVIFISHARAAGAGVKALAAYVNKAFFEDVMARGYSASQHDLAVIKTAQPVSAALPGVTYLDIPQTRLAGRWVGAGKAIDETKIDYDFDARAIAGAVIGFERSARAANGYGGEAPILHGVAVGLGDPGVQHESDVLIGRAGLNAQHIIGLSLGNMGASGIGCRQNAWTPEMLLGGVICAPRKQLVIDPFTSPGATKYEVRGVGPGDSGGPYILPPGEQGAAAFRAVTGLPGMLYGVMSAYDMVFQDAHFAGILANKAFFNSVFRQDGRYYVLQKLD